jgi:hypothetical protein
MMHISLEPFKDNQEKQNIIIYLPIAALQYLNGLSNYNNLGFGRCHGKNHRGSAEIIEYLFEELEKIK